MIEELKINLKKELSKQDINLIIFGETHGFLDDFSVQEEIIKIFNPNIFLYERLEEETLFSEKEKQNFLNQETDKDFSVISTFGDLKKTISLAAKYNLLIKGNDIKNMSRENKDFLKKIELTKEEEKLEEEILSEREKKQVQGILDSLKKGNKIFASTGAYHLREDSPLIYIQDAIPYLLIYFAYEDRQLFEPPENLDLSKLSLTIKRIFKDE